jgi:hypothetical protein
MRHRLKVHSRVTGMLFNVVQGKSICSTCGKFKDALKSSGIYLLLYDYQVHFLETR